MRSSSTATVKGEGVGKGMGQGVTDPKPAIDLLPHVKKKLIFIENSAITYIKTL